MYVTHRSTQSHHQYTARLWRVAEPLRPQTVGQWFGLLALIGGVGSITLLLLDGSRFFWSRAKVANGTNRYQQWIAQGLEVIMFAGSTGASVIGIRFVWAIFGSTVMTSAETSHETMTTLLSIVLTVNLIAGFFYSLLSPDNRQLGTLAKQAAKYQDKITSGLGVLLKDAEADVPAMLAPYSEHIQRSMTTAAVGSALEDDGQFVSSPPIKK